MSEAGRDDRREGEGDEVSEAFSGDNVRASWPFSLHIVRTNMAHCSPEGKEALISAFLWCTDPKHPVHRSEFARRVGYSANVIYKLLSGKYLHPESHAQLDVPADLVKSTKAFLAIERERFLGGKTEFVMTPTARRIWTAVDLARESRTPVFLWGPSHIGKTWALEAYAADNNHGRTPYCRMKAASGLGGMIRRICGSVGVSPESNTAELTERIKRALTSDVVLILDELHELLYTYRRASFFACIEVIREIYDEVECGMILCGTKLLEEGLQAGKDREMQQIMRRGVHRVSLPDMPTRGDLAAILKANGLEFPDKAARVTVQRIEERPYELLRMLAKRAGLKAITERLRYARKLASRRNKDLAWEHFVEAHLTIEKETQPENDWE